MYDSLLSALQPPQLWQRSTAAFWDDDHISKGMLAAHLNPEIDAASRKPETIDRSVDWIAGLIGEHRSILDLGCGPGLYARRLSNLGYTVTGVDCSRRSLNYARAHDSKTTYRCQNYLTLAEREQYDVILLIFCDYAALTAPERSSLLTRVYGALKPGGLFIFDVFTDRSFAGADNRKRWSYQPEGGFFCAKPHVLLESSCFYENGTVRADCSVVITEDGVTRRIIWDTAYTKERLLAETTPSGLTLRCAYDDICGTPHTGSSDTLCFVMEKA